MMESIEEVAIPKTKIERWGYQDYFRGYLLLLSSKGSEALESINGFPNRIELNQRWHQVLNDLREESQNELERLVLIGYKEDRRRVFLPTFSVEGIRKYSYSEIPFEILSREIKRAKNQFGMEDLIGYIHSHPKTLPRFKGLGARIAEFTDKDQPSFSAGDLYWLVAGSPHQRFPKFCPMIGLVDGLNNIFAFKSRETFPLEDFSRFMDQTDFEKYWYEKFGYKYEGSLNEGRCITPISPVANLWKVNLGIAEKYRLALYKGKPGKDLARAYP